MRWIQIVLWELLAADIERIEGIGAVGEVYDWYYPARLLILAKKQPKYLEVTKFQSIFAKE